MSSASWCRLLQDKTQNGCGNTEQHKPCQGKCKNLSKQILTHARAPCFRCFFISIHNYNIFYEM